jgi:multidrug resistance efflux pump
MEHSEDPFWLRMTARLLGVAIIFSSVAVVIYISRLLYQRPRTDDAVVRANIVGITSQVSGPITELDVADNQEVEEGDLLFVINPQPFEVELERAQANLLLVQSQLSSISNAVAAAKDEVQALEIEYNFQNEHAQRLKSLVAQNAISRDEYDAGQSKARAARADLEQSRQELSRQQSLLGQFGDSNAHLDVSKAAVNAAELNLSYCHVRAPFRGRVTNLNISKGKYAQAGQPVFALLDTRAWYVIANFQETYLNFIRPGMAADIFLLSYPGQRFRGKVEGIGWAVIPQGMENDGVLPNVNPTLNWVRLAQRIPVRIRLENMNTNSPYRMGMSAVVTLDNAPGAISITRPTSPP